MNLTDFSDAIGIRLKGNFVTQYCGRQLTKSELPSKLVMKYQKLVNGMDVTIMMRYVIEQSVCIFVRILNLRSSITTSQEGVLHKKQHTYNHRESSISPHIHMTSHTHSFFSLFIGLEHPVSSVPKTKIMMIPSPF